MSHRSKKKIFLLLAGLLVLSACGRESVETPKPIPSAEVVVTPTPTPVQTPEPTPYPLPTPDPYPKSELWGFPIDDTHDAFEVPTGGKLGTVLVTVELAENEEEVFEAELQFSVWTADDLEKPLQTMTAEWVWSFHWKDVRDANFDGYQDFGYMFAMGNQPAYYHYWIWNEEQGLFVAEPEFDQISWPEFDEETGIISGYARGGFAGAAGTTTFHRWIDGKLVCVRKIVTFPYGADTLNEIRLTVEESVNGVLTEIFRVETDIGTAFEEAQKWKDLDYHGE